MLFQVNTFLDLYWKATEMMYTALAWQSNVGDIITNKKNSARLRDKENIKISNR